MGICASFDVYNTGEYKASCPGKHRLKEFKAPTNTYVCDVCRGYQKENSPIHGCRTCDYDICDSCYRMLLVDEHLQYHVELMNKIYTLELPVLVREIITDIASDSTRDELDFRDNNFSDEAADAIGKGLSRNTKLKKLYLEKNRISAIGAAGIGEGLGKNLTLRELYLSDNNIGDVGATAIGEGLGRNATLKELYLKRNKINDAGAVGIGEGLCKNVTLIIISLSENSIGDVGAAAIGEGLSQNAALKELYLRKNNIGDSGAVAIGESLCENGVLEDLYLSENNIGDVGAAGIGKGLDKNSSLKDISLRENNISDVGIYAIAKCLSNNNTLQKLHLNGNKMTHSGLLALAKAFRWHENLEVLDADSEGAEYENPEAITEIERGNFGCVSLAATKDSTEVVVKKSHGGSNREEIYEKLILQGLPEHPNVVRLAALSVNDTLLLEAHKGGSLRDYAKNHKDGVPLQQFLSYSHGMCLAIEHLHRHGLVHRDIALRNYVLTEDLQTPILVDFGLSWPIEEEKAVDISPLEMLPFRQCAPEVLSVLSYSKAADIWQLGLAFWQLLHRGRQPFFQLPNCQQLVLYLNKKMSQDNSCSESVPLSFKKNGAACALIDTVREVVVLCCKYDPAERPTAAQLVEKINSLKAHVGIEAEEKEVSPYEPDKNCVEGGLKEYNYTDYQRLKTGGRSDYVQLEKEMEEHQYDELEFSDVDMDGEAVYQELEKIPVE